MADLSGKACLITGGAAGIGRGIAQVFVERGALVVLADRDQEQGQAAAAALGDRAVFCRCDVSQPEQVAALVAQALSRHGRIDVLVNNAGVDFCKPFEETTLADWDRVIGVDLRGTFLCTRACIEIFLKQGAGSVVNIASVHSLAVMPGSAPYDAAKWGVVGMTKTLAVEYASRGIRFNCVSPGLIDTRIWQDIQGAAADRQACLNHWWANIPAGRVGTARDIGLAAAFLASDDAAYITGANLQADGGMTSQLISKESFAKRPRDGQ